MKHVRQDGFCNRWKRGTGTNGQVRFSRSADARRCELGRGNGITDAACVESDISYWAVGF